MPAKKIGNAPKLTPQDTTAAVDAFLAALEHPFKSEIELLRAIVLGPGRGGVRRSQVERPELPHLGVLRDHAPARQGHDRLPSCILAPKRASCRPEASSSTTPGGS